MKSWLSVVFYLTRVLELQVPAFPVAPNWITRILSILTNGQSSGILSLPPPTSSDSFWQIHRPQIKCRFRFDPHESSLLCSVHPMGHKKLLGCRSGFATSSLALVHHPRWKSKGGGEGREHRDIRWGWRKPKVPAKRIRGVLSIGLNILMIWWVKLSCGVLSSIFFLPCFRFSLCPLNVMK